MQGVLPGPLHLTDMLSVQALDILASEVPVGELPGLFSFKMGTMSTRWYEYVLQVSDGMTARQIAKQSGMHSSNITNWKQGQAPTPRLAVQFARGMSVNVLAALVAAEVITAEEAGGGLGDELG